MITALFSSVLTRVLRSAATLQEVVPDAVLVGGSTIDETLRVKAYLVVQRNVVRDYLDVVALAEHLGPVDAVRVLSGIDAYYDDRSGEEGSVLTSLVVALADPAPFDVEVTEELARYKGLDPRWHEWSSVVEVCRSLALDLVGAT